jgi:hypothetical protein
MSRTLNAAFTALTLSACLSAPQAAEVDWFAGLRLSDGGRSYLSLSAAHFGAHREQTVAVARRLPHPEADLPVLLFLAHESGRPLSFILDLRLNGASWWEIRARLGVRPSRVVAVVPHDPGPPYGKAWGYYKKHPRGGKHAVVLTDDEFADWVGVRVLAHSYGLDPMRVLEARRSGMSLGQVTVRHQKDKAVAAGRHRGGPPSKQAGNGKGNGKSRGKGTGQ